MIFVLISLIVPLLTYLFLPYALKTITLKKPPERSLLVIAGVLFFLSWFLPSPDIQGENTAAVTHFLGGGVFTGFVWLYIKEHLRWRAYWVIELLSLLALVSLLGVANELFELVAVRLGLIELSLSDTPWDLLMNTLGAITFWIFYKLIVRSTTAR